MSESGAKAVFLSYASQDAEAARRICEALRSGGVEVWFDADGGLEHGDEWDAKIRKQIKECVLFVAVISANTQARHEGYFRIEWELAAQRAMGIASGVAFILPVVIDDTREPEALVPDRFRLVQWTRLPGGVVTPDVKARYLKLWSHRVGALKDGLAPGSSAAVLSDAGVTPALPKASRRVRASAWITATGAAIVVALALGWPWASIRPVTPASPSAPLPSAQRTSLSESKRLLRQAEEVLRKTELGMSEIDIASRLCDRAVALDPSDAEAWASASVVDSWAYFFSGDSSADRREGARAKAARAMNLAPNLFEARRAQACYLAYVVTGASQGENLASQQAEQLCRALWKERPGDYQTALVLGASLRKQRRFGEAHAFYDELARDSRMAAKMLNEKAWSLYTIGRIPEADATLDQSIAAEPFTGNVSLKVLLALRWHGDAELALTAWNKLPISVQLEDRALSAAILLFRWRREPERLLALLKDVPRDWVSWKFDGPIAAVKGDAHEMANRPAAARNDWRIALGVVERRLAQDRANRWLMQWRAYLQTALGDTADAAESLELARELPGGFGGGWMEMSARLSTPDQLMNSLERGANVWAGALRLNPAYDSVRPTPRFQALLAAVEKDPKRSPGAAKVAAEADRNSGGAAAQSVAVLPFANLSDDKDNEYFSDGISEELLTVLQKIPGLRVAARTSAFSFKGKNVAAPEIGAKLGVAHLVEGSVQKAGGRVKITARLSRVATGEELWSKSFPPLELKDVFATQSEIAQAIVAELRGQLTGEAAAEIRAQVAAAEVGGTRNVEAHQLYLQGKSVASRGSLDALGLAIGLFQQAVDRDPQFAQGWAALAGAALWRGFQAQQLKGEEGKSMAALAFRAVERALALEPNLAEGHLVRFRLQVFNFAWRGAQESLRHATRLAPSDALMFDCSAMLAMSFGQVGKAVELSRQAVGLDPVNGLLRLNYALALGGARHHDEAIAELRRISELNPEFPYVHGFVSGNLLAQARFSEAAAEAVLEGNPMWRMATLAQVYWAQRKKPEADAMLEQLLSGFADAVPYHIAALYAYRGDRDRAFEWLERAFLKRDPALAWFRSDWGMADLRTDLRTLPFLKKMGLADEQLK